MQHFSFAFFAQLLDRFLHCLFLKLWDYDADTVTEKRIFSVFQNSVSMPLDQFDVLTNTG